MDNSKKRQLFNPKHVDKGVDMWIFFEKNKRFDKILCKPGLKYNVFSSWILPLFKKTNYIE